MIESGMSQAAHIMNGQLQGADTTFRGVSIDSRTINAGELFIALQGPNFDGAQFLDKAAGKGAAGAVSQAKANVSLPTIVVENSHVALSKLAVDWRSRMPATIIAVTGSNGKTTLKELISACLSPVARTLATAGNLNNEIGLPLMLLRMAPEHRFAIFEMGANHAGEIARLTALAEPHIVVISNAGPAHLEGFGSLDGVAKAKGEILLGTPRPQFAVLNADDKYFDTWRAMAADSTILSFGQNAAATVRLQNVQVTADGSTFKLVFPGSSIDVTLPLSGAHNAMNAAAAAAVAFAVDLAPQDIKRGLESVQPVSGRLRPLAGVSGIRLFDDSYNANPTSVIAAARFLAAQPGDATFVFGDMGELGSDSVKLHTMVGAEIRNAGVSRLFATGELAKHAVTEFGSDGQWCETMDELIAAVQKNLSAGTNVLVKGSRSMRMERVVDALRTDKQSVSG
ncbi:MAG: UDP-N-acetylmuramoyl-tripeptide--D-alanyl-D-alanine ligase [Woeseia sp.]